MILKKYFAWVVFFIFAAIALYSHSREPLFLIEGKLAAGKLINWLLFFAFLAYSLYCSAKENIFKTVKRIYPFYWARQIGLDLYLGLVISLFIIYLNEGSFLIMALWVIPVLLFANLATLLYFAMNFDSIFSMFLTSQ